MVDRGQLLAAALQGVPVDYTAIPNGPTGSGFLVRINADRRINKKGLFECYAAFEYSLDQGGKRYAHWMQDLSLEEAIAYIKGFAA